MDEERYSAEETMFSIFSGRNDLISTPKTENMFPMGPSDKKIADSVVALNFSSKDRSTGRRFDDCEFFSADTSCNDARALGLRSDVPAQIVQGTRGPAGKHISAKIESAFGLRIATALIITEGRKMVDDFKFEIGAMYENMKGHYEVVSIHRNAMVIRWDSGDEIATTVDLQKRIIERMAHEKEEEKKDSEVRKSIKKKKKK